MNYELYISRYLDYHKALFHSSKTIQTYKEVLYAFFKFLRSVDMLVLSSDSFICYQLFLRKKGLTGASVSSYLRHIKAFVHWLGLNGYIDDVNLYRSIRLPKQSKKNVYIYTSAEIKYIYSAVSVSSYWLTLRNKLIISLMLDSGLRRHECCLIRKIDLDLSSDILTVHGKGSKDRIVPIGSVTKSYILSYLECVPYDSDFLLLTRTGEYLTDNSVKLFFSKISKTMPFDFSAHKLRHNFATNFLIDSYEKNGFYDAYTLRVLLGHEDLSTTDRYVHLASQYIATRHRVSHLDKVFLQNNKYKDNKKP